MSNTKVTEGKTIRYAHSAAVASGETIKIGLMVGIAAAAYAINVEGDYYIGEVHEVPKVSAQAWAIGVQVYWDDTAKLYTTVATANIAAGRAWEAAANPTAKGKVLLNSVGGTALA